ncbi:hypothetical protein [Luteimonas suaedae]|uniref:hypothetical protein n=1 Tax=Luteimonas suaedae TaxID=2605430 RepID=UPI0011EFBA3D|nr:hypothetical protein [Luteimonas suaedae]
MRATDLPVRALMSGSVASALSTLTLSWLCHRDGGALASGTNATSHWFWGETARYRDAPSLRHTLLGYAIHHASSVFWACGFERLAGRRARPARIAAAAGLTAALAYVVDYHVVPRRLTPGFERHLPASGMLATYVAFAVGLCLGSRACRRGVVKLARRVARPARRAVRAAPATRTTAPAAPAPPPRSRD